MFYFLNIFYHVNHELGWLQTLTDHSITSRVELPHLYITCAKGIPQGSILRPMSFTEDHCIIYSFYDKMSVTDFSFSILVLQVLFM